MKFDRRTAVITGAATGIGKAAAKLLADMGVALVLIDRDAETLSRTSAELRGLGNKVIEKVCDISSRDDIDRIVGTIKSECPRIDILINNAGIWRDNCKKFWETTPESWENRWRVNVFGLMYLTHELLPEMISQNYGRIINVASVAGIYGIVNMVDYSATKGAVIAFTKALAKETAPYNVLVTAVSPGNIGIGNEPSELSYLGRTGSYEECAEMICFLASDNASFCSGQSFQVDGCRKKM